MEKTQSLAFRGTVNKRLATVQQRLNDWLREDEIL